MDASSMKKNRKKNRERWSAEERDAEEAIKNQPNQKYKTFMSDLNQLLSLNINRKKIRDF